MREKERSYRQIRERSETNLCLIVYNQKIKVLISFQQGKINAITMEENSLILAIPFMWHQKEFSGGWGNSKNAYEHNNLIISCMNLFVTSMHALTQKMDTELDSCLFYFERIGMNDLFWNNHILKHWQLKWTIWSEIFKFIKNIEF